MRTRPQGQEINLFLSHALTQSIDPYTLQIHDDSPNFDLSFPTLKSDGSFVKVAYDQVILRFLPVMFENKDLSASIWLKSVPKRMSRSSRINGKLRLSFSKMIPKITDQTGTM